jgi:anti-sigma regulatory factor (Ser/Thr protein kinase)
VPWPLSTSLELAALDSAVLCARKHARLISAEWGLREMAGTIELVTSELMTNAVRASAGLPSPVVRMWLVSDGRSMVIRVQDRSGHLPRQAEESLYAERGRGLLLVSSLSRQWGVDRHPPGKIVWALV